MERKRSVEASLTEAEEALYEDVLEVLTEAKEAACVSSQDDIVNDDKSKSDGQPSSDSASTDGADAKLLEFKCLTALFTKAVECTKQNLVIASLTVSL
ncbi:hypothetical protein MRX96_047790 [Rhipicephalus microplus]